MNKIQLTKESMQDILSLPKELQQDCLAILRKLDNNIHLGIALENKNDKDLRGLYKLYFAEAKYRIVYRIIDGKSEVVGVEPRSKAEVIGVGKRDREEIYNIVHRRIMMQKQ